MSHRENQFNPDDWFSPPLSQQGRVPLGQWQATYGRWMGSAICEECNRLFWFVITKDRMPAPRKCCECRP